MNWKKILLILAVLGFIAALFWKQIYAAYLSFTTGATAAQQAATLNGYTTYNQSTYVSPLWQPILTFFRANAAYIPNGQSAQNGSNPASYSVQG